MRADPHLLLSVSPTRAQQTPFIVRRTLILEPNGCETGGNHRNSPMRRADFLWQGDVPVGIPSSSSGWATLYHTVRNMDEAKVRDCKEEMDSLLVFVSRIRMRAVRVNTIVLICFTSGRLVLRGSNRFTRRIL